MLRNIDQMETGILLTKLSVVLAQLNHGKPEEKKQARVKIEELMQTVSAHVDPHAFKIASINLGFTEEEMHFIENAI